MMFIFDAKRLLYPIFVTGILALPFLGFKNFTYIFCVLPIRVLRFFKLKPYFKKDSK